MAHPEQPPLDPNTSAEWDAARNDAGVDADTSLLIVLPDACFDGSSPAMLYPRGTLIEDAQIMPYETRSMLNRSDVRVGVDRVLGWFHNLTVEDVAALLRHELEHARQFQAVPGWLISTTTRIPSSSCSPIPVGSISRFPSKQTRTRRPPFTCVNGLVTRA